MRADRLVATLLLLQARGRVTAADVAAELEVSERTARRDLEALAVAGIPVYSQQGRGGGWSLVGGARTDLSGLTASEARALFLTAGPAATATPAMKAALRKLVQALPATFRAEAEAAARAVVVDPAAWGREARHGGGTPAGAAWGTAGGTAGGAAGGTAWGTAGGAAGGTAGGSAGDADASQSPPFLDALQRAVIEGVQVRLGYVGRERNATERVVHPLGLVVKGTVWYLLAGTEAGQRTFRVTRVTSVTPTGDPVERPPGFDLADVWRDVAASIDARRAPVEASVLADPSVVGIVRYLFGTRARISPAEATDESGHRKPTSDARRRRPADGRVELVIRGHAIDSLAGELGGLGSSIEVLSPPAVRRRLAEIGAELTALYADEPGRRV